MAAVLNVVVVWNVIANVKNVNIMQTKSKKAQLKIPSKIHFAGFDFTVIETNNLDAGENYGRTDMKMQQIHLDKSVHPQKKFETFIHELMHVAYRYTTNELTAEMEEKIVALWSKNIFGILKDNNLLK